MICECQTSFGEKTKEKEEKDKLINNSPSKWRIGESQTEQANARKLDGMDIFTPGIHFNCALSSNELPSNLDPLVIDQLIRNLNIFFIFNGWLMIKVFMSNNIVTHSHCLLTLSIFSYYYYYWVNYFFIHSSIDHYWLRLQQQQQQPVDGKINVEMKSFRLLSLND